MNGIMQNNILSEMWVYTYEVLYDRVNCRVTSGGLITYAIGI